MSAEEIVYEEPGTELARVEAQPPTLFGTADPAMVIQKATDAAKPLADVIKKQRLTTTISGREHVRVEGWTLLGSMLGVFPVCVWTRKLENGWEARVEARTRDGAVVGAAEAECLASERTWANRDDYALRSMAQTRATSKALRQPLGFVMQLAGFEATPAEEMAVEPRAAAAAPAQRQTPESAAAPSTTSEFKPPAGAADALGLQSSRADYVPDTSGGDPALVRVHFGKNATKTLGELSPKQREWYATQWTPNPEYADEHDRRLKEAAQILCGITPDAVDLESEIPF